MPLPFFGLGVAAIGTRAQQARGMDRRLPEGEGPEVALAGPIDEVTAYRLISQLTSDYVYSLVPTPAGDFELEWVSDGFERVTGYTLQEIQAAGGWTTLVDASQEEVKDEGLAALAAGSPVTRELKLVTKSGETAWVRGHLKPILDQDGTLLRIVGSAQDITAEKKAMEEAERHQARLVASFEEAAIGVAILSPTGQLIEVNPEFTRMLDRPRDELTGRELCDFALPEDEGLVRSLGVKIVAGAARTERIMVRFALPSRDVVIARISVSLVWDPAGQPDYLVAQIVDVTEQQNTLRRLRERERTLAEAERIGQLGSVEWDLRDQSVTWSDELFRIFGVKPGELVPSYDAWLELVHPDDRDEVDAFAKRVVVEGRPYDVYFRIISKDGRGTRLVHSMGEVERDASGRPARIMATCRDVTEQMADKSALASEAARFRLLSSIARASNTTTPVDEVLQLALEEVCLFTGWDVAHSFLVDEQDGEALLASDRWFQSGDSDIEEFRSLTESTPFLLGRGLPGRALEARAFVSMPDLGDGAVFPRREVAHRCGLRSGHAFPILSGSSVLGVLEFFTFERSEVDADLEALMVTVGVQLGRALERQRSSAALRESEERFRSLAESAIDAIVSADHRGNIWYVNPAMERTFGYCPDELVGKPLTILMPARFRAAHSAGLQAFGRSGEGRVSGNIFHQVGLKKDGSEFPVEIALSHRITSQGIVFTSMIRDISDRVASEQQVHQSLSLLNATFDSIEDGIAAIDHKGDRIRDYNRRLVEMWAIPEEMLARGSAFLVREHIIAQSKDPEWLRRVTMEVLADPERESHHMIELLDGRIIERRIVPQRVDGRVVGRVASYRDVTQERRATSLLLDEARILEAVARDVPLAEVLDDLCRTVERYATAAVCSVLLLSENDTLRFAAGPSLEWFHRQIGPVPVADGAGSCGTAAYTGEAVICEDVRADPRWADYVEAADAHDLRSAWSIPVKASGGSVIGTFALYHRTPRRPSEDELRVVEVSASLAAVAIERDVALRQRLALEDRIRQSEKMESVGRLAGGVAHDLGNVLSAVTLNCDLLRYEVTSEPGKESLRDLEVAAGMAGRLVDDLLNLMRPPNPRVVDLNSLVGEMTSLLESVVQESVRVQVELEASPSLAQIDPDQLRQVLLNLVVNAKEAMPEGGTVFVRTANPKLSTITGTCDHVILTVTDSGVGMDPETQQRAFEPFFTTKRGPGTKGVGLGLASAHAAVTQVGGNISLLSWPGRGTVVSILLPCAGEEGDTNE